MEGLIAHRGARLLGRQDLLGLPTPEATETHKPIPHAKVVEALVASLGYRHLEVVDDHHAVTADASRMFGVLALSVDDSGVRFAIGVRNSHDKSLSLGLTVGYRVFVCDNLAFYGDFTPVTRKHSKRLDHAEVIDAALGKMQRHFEPMKRQIDAWENHTLPDAEAKLLIYDAFVAGHLAAPWHLARLAHERYFSPKLPDFEPRRLWSLSNAFTAAFKELFKPNWVTFLKPLPSQDEFQSFGLGKYMRTRFWQALDRDHKPWPFPALVTAWWASTANNGCGVNLGHYGGEDTLNNVGKFVYVYGADISYGCAVKPTCTSSFVQTFEIMTALFNHVVTFGCTDVTLTNNEITRPIGFGAGDTGSCSPSRRQA